MVNKENEKETVCCMEGYGPCPIPQNGEWNRVKDIKDISGLSHGVGGCAPRQGACKLTVNVEKGIIVEALCEIIGCSGATQSCVMASEILVGKTLLEALNTDLVCDAINSAMKDVFTQLVYGRSQSAFSLGGLKNGACLEELGKNMGSQVGTAWSSNQNGVRYFNTTEGYTKRLALDNNGEIIGYEYIDLNRFMLDMDNGVDVHKALVNNTRQYGRYSEGVKFINPRKE